MALKTEKIGPCECPACRNHEASKLIVKLCVVGLLALVVVGLGVKAAMAL